MWCIVQTFGGRVGLYGGVPQVAANLQAALSSPQRGNLDGLGLIMEGFGYNPVVYELVTDMTWRETTPDLDDWLGRLRLSRGGLRGRDRRVFAALRAAGVPVVVVLAGGYARQVEDTVKIHVATIAEAAAA